MLFLKNVDPVPDVVFFFTQLKKYKFEAVEIF